MFLITTLKDYIDHLNNLYVILNDNFTIFIFLKSFFIFLYQSISLFFVYILSLKWLTDFIEFPAIFKHNYIAILEGKNIFNASLEMQIDKSFFLFLENSSLNSKNFFTGLLNSFFLVLPFSVSSFLSIRAFIINGLPAGISAAVGTIIGQILFFACILFGFEFLFFPFLYCEGICLCFGLFFLINLLYKMIHTPNMLILNFAQKQQLFDLFKINFILSFFEQTVIFNYFGNLTVNGSPNLLQTNDFHENFFFIHFLYLLGLLIGSLIWTVCLGFAIQRVRNFLFNSVFNISFIQFNERFHSFSVLILTILCFSNIPYYGLDYLCSGPLGFIYEDKALEAIKPKTIYMTETNLGADKPVAIATNNLTFDKLNPIPENGFQDEEGTLKYEHYTLNSEFMWKNKFALKSDMMRMNDFYKQIRTSQRTFINKKNWDISPYETPNLENYSDLSKENKDNLENVLNAVFRDDVYCNVRKQTDIQSNSFKMSLVHHQFREKYYTNPVYKFITHFDMHPFLAGQPKSSNLTVEDEVDLFQRRIILQNYLNSAEYYKNLIQQKSKSSYAEKIYNQQFKGSLSLIRRFNAVHLNYNFNQNLNPVENLEFSKKVLKFDQPRFNEFWDEDHSLLHEELDLDSSLNSHSESSSSLDDFSNSLVLNNTAPFYIGWDGELRKFLIKTSSFPNHLKVADEMETISNLDTDTNQNWSSFSFQSWSPALDFENNQSYISSQNKLKLPAISIAPDELLKLKQALEFDEVIPVNSSDLKTNVTNVLSDQTMDSLLTRAPAYDWRWKKSTIDLHLKKYLNLGDATPPQLDGIAWPGVNSKFLFQKLIR